MRSLRIALCLAAVLGSRAAFAAPMAHLVLQSLDGTGTVFTTFEKDYGPTQLQGFAPRVGISSDERPTSLTFVLFPPDQFSPFIVITFGAGDSPPFLAQGVYLDAVGGGTGSPGAPSLEVTVQGQITPTIGDFTIDDIVTTRGRDVSGDVALSLARFSATFENHPLDPNLAASFTVRGSLFYTLPEPRLAWLALVLAAALAATRSRRSAAG